MLADSGVLHLSIPPRHEETLVELCAHQLPGAAAHGPLWLLGGWSTVPGKHCLEATPQSPAGSYLNWGGSHVLLLQLPPRGPPVQSADLTHLLLLTPCSGETVLAGSSPFLLAECSFLSISRPPSSIAASPHLCLHALSDPELSQRQLERHHYDLSLHAAPQAESEAASAGCPKPPYTWIRTFWNFYLYVFFFKAGY